MAYIPTHIEDRFNITEWQNYITFGEVNYPTVGSTTYINNNISDATTGNYVGAWEMNTTDTGIRYTLTNCVIYDPYVHYIGTSGISNNISNSWFPFNERVMKAARLKNNLILCPKSRSNLIGNISPNEKIALETLREMVTELEYRKYLKYGFVTVKGKSGDDYQIFRNRSHTRVWRGGKVVEEICVRIKDYAIPATDNIIAFKSMIEAGAEEDFKKSGNVFKVAQAA